MEQRVGKSTHVTAVKMRRPCGGLISRRITDKRRDVLCVEYESEETA